VNSNLSITLGTTFWVVLLLVLCLAYFGRKWHLGEAVASSFHEAIRDELPELNRTRVYAGRN